MPAMTPHAEQPEYWRAVADLSASAAHIPGPGGEFPPGAADCDPELSRRDFLTLLGASAALATACTRQPRERILPYAERPPEVVPGVPLHYATSMPLDGYATGLLVESHEGRPTKIEGNPDHPASLGAAGVYEQASVLGLYDPDRARIPRVAHRSASWEEITTALVPQALRPHVGTRGAGLHVLLQPSSSSLVASLLARVRTVFPESAIHFHASLVHDAPLAASRALFGMPLQPLYDLRHADVLVALDADTLASGPFHLRYAHDFAMRRRLAKPTDAVSRLYVAEPCPTPTGSIADHRLRTPPSGIVPLLAALLTRLAALDVPIPGGHDEVISRLSAI